MNGGLLTTCGLTHVGAPETDDETGEYRDFHGNYTRLRVPSISVDVSENARQISLRGTVAEAVLYGVQLRLQRRYTLTLGVPEIVIEDVVTNLSDQTAPLMLLYHFNFGYPLVAAGTRLATASVRAYPGNPAAQKNSNSWPEYGAATPEYDTASQGGRKWRNGSFPLSGEFWGGAVLVNGQSPLSDTVEEHSPGHLR